MKLRRLWWIVAFGCMLFFTTPAFAEVQYKDVDVTTKEGQAIMQLTEAGVVGGYEDGSFRPQGQLTRAEFVRIVNGVFHYQRVENTITAFDDIQGHWAQGEIEIAQLNGYIGGVGYLPHVGNHCFAPDMVLTREQVAVILSRILELENVFQMKLVLHDAVSDWARADVEKAIVCGLFQLEENNTFRATQPITRAEVCVVLAPYVQQLEIILQQMQIQSALEEASIALHSLHYTDANRTRLLAILCDCLDDALQESEQGTEITREYIEREYHDQIETARNIYYHALSNDDRIELRPDIVNSMSLDAVSILYDYFLADEVDVALDDKLEEIERDQQKL